MAFYSDGGEIEHLDLCGLPTAQGILTHLLQSPDMADDFPRNESDLLASDPVFCACAASAATAIAFRGDGPFPATFESIVGRLGPRGLAALAANIAFRQQYSTVSMEDSAIARKLTAQGMLRSRIALGLAERSGYRRPEEARFVASVLDLGRIALLALPDAPRITDLGEGGDAKLGAHLLGRWGYGLLPSDALLYQHEPTQQLVDAHPLVRIAHAARRLSEAKPSGLGQVCSEIGTLLNSDAEEIRTLTESALSRVPAADRDGLQAIPEERAEASRYFLPEALLQRAHLGEMLAYWSGAHTEQEVLRAIGQVLALFFGIRRMLYLRCDGNLLRGTELFENEPTASEIAIRLHANGSLIARATSDNKLLHSCDNESSGLTVVDREVSRALACGGMLCMPLSVNGKPLGTFVVGLPPFRCNWLKSQLGLLRDVAGHAAQTLATTERRQAHSAWIQHEAQSDCTLRARRAAHELRTPITVMRNYVSVMQMKLARSQPIETDLETISDELMRSDRIIEEFAQGFQRPAGDSKLALNTMIREVAGLLGDTLTKDRGINLTLSLDDKIPAELDSDAQAVRQIILNLTRNALEAMREGDGLRLSTEDHVRFENGDYVTVTVADTGPGLPAEILANLFEPVHSAKGEYHQGIGLSIVKHLANRMDARIICRSRQDVGTTFTVFLPRIYSQSQP